MRSSFGDAVNSIGIHYRSWLDMNLVVLAVISSLAVRVSNHNIIYHSVDLNVALEVLDVIKFR